MNHLSEELMNRMRDEHLNQKQFASKLGIHPTLLSQIISRKKSQSYRVAKAIYHHYPDLAEVLLK